MRRVVGQFLERRWLVAAVAVYLALTAVEAFRLVAFDRPDRGSAGLYDWELAASVPGPELQPSQMVEDGGATDALQAPIVSAVPLAADRILVTWNSQANVLAHDLEMASYGGAWQVGALATQSIESVYPAEPGSTYCFRVRGTGRAGHSRYGYPSPPCVIAAEPIRYRWTKDAARIIEPAGGRILILRMHSGRPFGEQVPVSVTIDGAPLERILLADGAWRTLRYFLPILQPEGAWHGDPLQGEYLAIDTAGRASTATTTTVRSVDGPRPSGFEELYPWDRDKADPPLTLDFAVASTFVPAEGAPETDSDRRTLGIRLARLQWEDQVPPEGIGFHDWEESAEGVRFRWTRIQASQPGIPAGRAAVFSVRADHPDIDEEPVVVEVFWNERRVEEVVLRDRAWTRVRVEVAAGDVGPGVLSVRVDRAWIPAESGGSADRRTLGVAMTEVAWQ